MVWAWRSKDTPPTSSLAKGRHSFNKTPQHLRSTQTLRFLGKAERPCPHRAPVRKPLRVDPSVATS